jgi:hypothetical protein
MGWTMKRDYFFFFFVFFLTTFLAMLCFSFWLTPGRIITESAMRARASVNIFRTAQGRNTNAPPRFFRPDPSAT